MGKFVVGIKRLACLRGNFKHADLVAITTFFGFYYGDGVARSGRAGRCTARVERLDCVRGNGWNGEETVSVARVTEISASSKKSFEDAIKHGVDRASKTLRNVQGAWIKEQKACVKNGKITEYRVNMQVTFVLDD